MKKGLWYSLVLTILCSTFPVLSLWDSNFEQATFSEVATSMACSLVIGIVFFAISSSINKTGFLSAYLIIAFWTFTPIANFSKIPRPWLLAILCVTPVLAALIVRRSKSLLSNSIPALVFFATCLNLPPLVGLINSAISQPNGSAKDEAGAMTKVEYLSNSRGGPDLYYIILDGYIGNIGARQVLDFDNSAFTGALEERSFFIGEKSRANYPITLLSLTSTLNMNYLDLDELGVSVDSEKLANLHYALQQNAAFTKLKARGYKIVNISSEWAGTAKLENADTTLARRTIGGEFLQALMGQTPVRRFLAQKNLRSHQKRIEFGVEALKDSANIKGPKFVFCHIIAPHPPFVLGETSGASTDNSFTSWIEPKRYIQQTQILNAMILEAIDYLLSAPGEKVIVIQGDHGSAFGLKDGHSDPQPKDMLERFSILNAIYASEECKGKLYSSISPVNNLRVVFSSYFGENLEILEDASFYSWYDRLYDFERVEIPELDP